MTLRERERRDMRRGKKETEVSFTEFVSLFFYGTAGSFFESARLINPKI